MKLVQHRAGFYMITAFVMKELKTEAFTGRNIRDFHEFRESLLQWNLYKADTICAKKVSAL